MCFWDKPRRNARAKSTCGHSLHQHVHWRAYNNSAVQSGANKLLDLQSGACGGGHTASVWSELGVKPATCVMRVSCPKQTKSHISILTALVLAYFLPGGRWSYLLPLPQLIRLSSTNSSYHTFKGNYSQQIESSEAAGYKNEGKVQPDTKSCSFKLRVFILRFAFMKVASVSVQ